MQKDRDCRTPKDSWSPHCWGAAEKFPAVRTHLPAAGDYDAGKQTGSGSIPSWPKQTRIGVVQHIRRRAGPPRAQEATDAELLRSFLERRDESAFSTLLERYGRLVMRV